MCSAAYLFMSWRQNVWFIVRLAEGSCYVPSLLLVVRRCCSLRRAVRSPRYAPSGSVPFIISFQTFIWSLWGISPLDSWHSQWKTSIIYGRLTAGEAGLSSHNERMPLWFCFGLILFFLNGLTYDYFVICIISTWSTKVQSVGVGILLNFMLCRHNLLQRECKCEYLVLLVPVLWPALIVTINTISISTLSHSQTN